MTKQYNQCLLLVVPVLNVARIMDRTSPLLSINERSRLKLVSACSMANSWSNARCVVSIPPTALFTTIVTRKNHQLSNCAPSILTVLNWVSWLLALHPTNLLFFHHLPDNFLLIALLVQLGLSFLSTKLSSSKRSLHSNVHQQIPVPLMSVKPFGHFF